MLQRPTKNEYPDYYVPYVNLVPEANLVQLLQENLKKTITLFEGISEEVSLHRYAPGKWSIKEVLGHITDTERIMSYRLLRVGRGDQTPLAGFDENDYVQAAQTNNLSLKTILEDFKAARNSTITLVQNLPESAWANIGNANGTEITTRAIAYIIAGHQMHHCKIVEDRYL
ncbi:putative damage-inducible protein DinB [Neobacillus niacini]|uniref:DinB family protein n=1 Tax=Neobacillus niacini TaxID=86668 RepID=UPI00285D04EC|nr:DinB family protein [Neobacillus niacini]MDR7076932.1 putative damage-inducible protein DinB [Neobacillus niacini]